MRRGPSNFKQCIFVSTRLRRWYSMPRTGQSWQGGDYQLVIRVPDGPVRKEVFGLR